MHLGSAINSYDKDIPVPSLKNSLKAQANPIIILIGFLSAIH